MAASIPEIAQSLAVACLNHETFALRLISPESHIGDAQARGKNIGQFYQAIYKMVAEAVELSAEKQV